MSRLEWIEHQGAQAVEFHLANIDRNVDQANETLNHVFLMISGCIAGLSVFLPQAEWRSLAAAFGVTGLWLTGSAVFLVWRCLLPDVVQSPTNEPKNLTHPEYTDANFDQVRQLELENLQSRITHNQTRGNLLGKNLRIARKTVAISPLILAGVALIWALVELFLRP